MLKNDKIYNFSRIKIRFEINYLIIEGILNSQLQLQSLFYHF